MKKLLIKYFSDFLSLIGIEAGSKALPSFLLLLSFSLYPLSLLAPPKVSASELDQKDRVFRTPRPYELLRKIIKAKADKCIAHLKYAREAISAARGSLNIVDMIPEEFNRPQRSSLLRNFFHNNEWVETDKLWLELRRRINFISKELNPLLDSGSAQAAMLLECFYAITAQFVYEIYKNGKGPQEIALATRKMIETLDQEIIPDLSQIKQQFPGCFICTHSGLKEALLLCQKELLKWNEAHLVFVREVTSPYLLILNAKHAYLLAGVELRKMSDEEAQEWISKVIRATQLLAEMRLKLTGHNSSV